MSPYMKTIQEHLCWQKLCPQFTPRSKYCTIKTIWFCEDFSKETPITQDQHCQTIRWYLYKRSQMYCFWIFAYKDYGMIIPFTPHNLNVLVPVSRGSVVPGHFDLGIWLVRRVKVPLEREILYSTTWWVRILGLTMSDSIENLIETLFIANLLEKDLTSVRWKQCFFYLSCFRFCFMFS